MLTIHNIGYQGVFDAGIVADLDIDWSRHLLHHDHLQEGYLSFLETGILHADRLTTVSPTHALELMSDAYGMGLQGLLRERASSLTGILNGVDTEEWDPATDSMIPANYSADDLTGKAACKEALLKKLGLEVVPGRPLVGVVTRLVAQKGIELILEALPGLLSRIDFTFVVLGSGAKDYEHGLWVLQQQFPGRVCFYRGYNAELSHWIEAGSDLYLMPSLYEPCGLNQMYSLRYGTVPVVRATGGLADSVEPINPMRGSGTGILFDHYDATGLAWGLGTGLALYRDKKLWRKIVLNGMAKDFSWEHQIEAYLELYRGL